MRTIQFCPRRLRVACSQEYVFNKLAVMDILHLVNREPTLNMICFGTKLMVTHELAGRFSYEVWKAFFFEWVLRFIGPPQFLVVVAAREFISTEFRNNFSAADKELLEKATEAHWSFGVCE